jgi:hypothetical protein
LSQRASDREHPKIGKANEPSSELVVRRDRIDLLQRQAGRCAACKSVFEPDLEQAAIPTSWCAAIPPPAGVTRVLVHRWCRPARPP